MVRRALLIGAVLAASGCGLTAIGTGVDPDGDDAGVDATTAPSATDAGTSAPGEVPGAGSNEIPIGDLDAGSTNEAGDGATPPPFEIIAPAGGAYVIFPPGTPLPCSVSGLSASFVLKNLRTDKVRLRWVDYACVEKDYGTVNKASAKTQPTYVGHRWRVQNDVDGSLLGDFALGAPGSYQVIVR